METKTGNQLSFEKRMELALKLDREGVPPIVIDFIIGCGKAWSLEEIAQIILNEERKAA